MFYTALIIGFMGSLHCVGMCSPLAMAVANLSPRTMISRLLYNSGRILTYSILGATVASVGFALPLTHYQNVMSLVLGLALVVLSVVSFGKMRSGLFFSFLASIAYQLKKWFSALLQKNNYGSVFSLGLINGLLPCGLSLLALTYCVILPSPREGFVFMLCFGLGTLPAMIGMAGILSKVITYFHLNILYATKAMFFISGILLVVRVFVFHTHDGPAHQSLVDMVMCR